MNMSEYPYRVTVKLKENLENEQQEKINEVIKRFLEKGVVKLDEITYGTNIDKHDASFLCILLSNFKNCFDKLEYHDEVDGFVEVEV